MITLYGFGRIFAEGIGETKDLRVQWALEELGLSYRVHALDHTAGELAGEAFGRISPFRQAPVLDDDGFVIAESAAIVMYLAEKAGALTSGDLRTRTRVNQWCAAAASTVGATFGSLDLLEIFDPEGAARTLHVETRKLAQRWLADLERQLAGRSWIATDDFSVADIMMAGTLRMIRKTDLMTPFGKVRSYYDRCFARPAWERTLALYAERLGVTPDAIR